MLLSKQTTLRLRKFAKRSILPHPIVRKLRSFTKFRFASGRPNVVLISIVLAKNVVVAILKYNGVRASNRAINLYRRTLRDLVSHDARQSVKLLHLIYGLKQNESFHYFHWALIERMISTIRPDRILFHCTYKPQGYYWEKTKKKVQVVKVPPFEYYGIAYLRHFAHKADVIRLLALYEMGGLYLDIDTLVFKSFDDLLPPDRLILGLERLPGSVEPAGLCNAVILAPRNHDGIRDWLRSYMYFRGKPRRHWEEHSVTLPLSLLKGRPDVKVLDSHCFFEIGHEEANLLFDPDRAALVEDRVAGSYSQHLWETSSMTNLLADFKAPAPANKSFLGTQLGRVSCELSSLPRPIPGQPKQVS